MKSNYKSVGWRDFLWGLFYSTVPALMPIRKVFTAGEFPSADVWYASAMQAIPLIIVYLVVHYFKNNRGELGKKDK